MKDYSCDYCDSKGCGICCKAKPASQWISVENRLPTDAKPVIIDGGCGHYSHKYKKWFTNMERDHFGEFREIIWAVTHWMPLPTPPPCE